MASVAISQYLTVKAQLTPVLKPVQSQISSLAHVHKQLANKFLYCLRE